MWAGLDAWRHYILNLQLGEFILWKKWRKLHITHRNRMQSCMWSANIMDKVAVFYGDLQRLTVSKSQICHLAVCYWVSYWTPPQTCLLVFKIEIMVSSTLQMVSSTLQMVSSTLSWWLAGIILVKPLAQGPAGGGQLEDASSLFQHPLPKLSPTLPAHLYLTCHLTLPRRKKILIRERQSFF